MANEKATADIPPTAAEFEQAFARAAKENPEILGSLLATAMLQCLKRSEEHDDKINKLAIASLAIAKKQGLVAASPAPAPAGDAPANGAPPVTGTGRKGADGRVLTPEEENVEAMMDSAEVDNSQPAPVLAGQGPAQKPRVGRPGVQPAPNGGGERRGADGKPLTPQEAAIEQMMDEAPVVND